VEGDAGSGARDGGVLRRGDHESGFFERADDHARERVKGLVGDLTSIARSLQPREDDDERVIANRVPSEDGGTIAQRDPLEDGVDARVEVGLETGDEIGATVIDVRVAYVAGDCLDELCVHRTEERALVAELVIQRTCRHLGVCCELINTHVGIAPGTEQLECRADQCLAGGLGAFSLGSHLTSITMLWNLPLFHNDAMELLSETTPWHDNKETAMKALYYDGVSRVEWRDDPEPVIEQPTDALVRPLAVATCDLDQEILRARVAAAQTPFAIGHEGSGEVVAVGSAITSLRPGDLVSIPYHLSCGACDRCADELPLFCRSTAAEGIASYGIPVGVEHGGLFSDLIRVPHADHGLVRLPPNVSPTDAASVGDNLTDAWRALVPHLRRRPGADVLIMGNASIGLFAVDIARASGAGYVRYVDADATKRSLAERFGAEAITPEAFSPDERSYDITFVTHGDQDALRGALLATGPGGHCENAGFHFVDVELPLFAMHLNCVTFRSALSNARSYMPDVLALLSSGRNQPQLVTTTIQPFESADQLATAGFKPVFVRDAIG
jgi:threonine dehydrogenase-like Zn-dependent dehydrogenase